jgi:hypothetical protein
LTAQNQTHFDSKDCIIPQQVFNFATYQKRWANPGFPPGGRARVRPRRAKITKLLRYCGRWADLFNYCTDRRFRPRTGVPLRLKRPLLSVPAPILCLFQRTQED